MEEAKKIWVDGVLVDWGEAKIHLVSNTVHYGFGVFEGIRCYKTESGPAVFRLVEHVDRLFNSARIMDLKIPYSKDEIIRACHATVMANGYESCYIRPIVFIGYGGMGLEYQGLPVSVAIIVWFWGEYLGEGALTRGIRVKTSSFTRIHLNANMTKAKACGNYMTFQMARAEARREGYDEALFLDPSGYVAEGPVENIFMVKRGMLKTPPLTAILEGVTRDTIMTLARDSGYAVEEQFFSRDELYGADEAFYCGTGAEVTPMREVDNRTIGEGRPGPITRELQDLFFRVVRGKVARYYGWLSFIQ